jgi:hypothetical protein
MPDMAPQQPTQKPASAAGAQSPMGNSPVTGPTPNQGYQAAGLQRVGVAVKVLTEALPLLGAGSDLGQAVLDALKKLSKLTQPGEMTPSAERNQLQDMMVRNQQQNGQLQAMQQRQAAGAQGGGPGGGAPGAGMQRAA